MFNPSFYLAIAITVAVLGLAVLYFFISRGNESGKREKKSKKKDKAALKREADRRLQQNPRDAKALLILAELAFEEEDFEKSYKLYKILLDLCATNPDLDEFEITLRHAISALKLKKLKEAYRGFMIARTLNAENFEVNHNLGYLEFLRKNYEKAYPLLKKAYILRPESIETLRYLAHSLFRIKKYSEAINYFKKLLDFEPEDMDALFVLGQSYLQLGQVENALKIFSHLRTNPKLGAHASLLSGSLRAKKGQFEKAIIDFEIGLKHENIRKEIKLETQYRLADAYIKTGDVESAISVLTDMVKSKPDYKDVGELLKQYKEISANRNLQVYLMSPTSEFIGLCRRLASSFFDEAITRLTNIALHKNEYVDILAEVSSRKWEDIVLFRFIRGTGVIGELMLRDLYARMKEIKAGRGICITAGEYSSGATDFVQARLIDLISGKELLKLFDKISGSTEKIAEEKV